MLRNDSSILATAAAVAALLLLGALLLTTSAAAQTPRFKAPRTPDGKPNLNGIWQAMNAANWDIEGHTAAPGPLPQLGAIGASPSGLSIIEGGDLPYLPDAALKKKENLANRFAADPEFRRYLPGVPRATYMPYPFQIVQWTDNTAFSTSIRESVWWFPIIETVHLLGIAVSAGTSYSSICACSGSA